MKGQIKIGDKVKIRKSASNGERVFTVIVKKVLSENKVKGEVCEGTFVGYTFTGNVIEGK